MSKKIKQNNEPVTREYFERVLDEHSNSIIEAVNFGFENINTKLGDNKEEHERIEKKMNQSWTIMDGYVKAQEDFREEFKIMKHKMSKIEKVIKLKLGVEIE